MAQITLVLNVPDANPTPTELLNGLAEITHYNADSGLTKLQHYKKVVADRAHGDWRRYKQSIASAEADTVIID